jgi:hypothetical protein
MHNYQLSDEMFHDTLACRLNHLQIACYGAHDVFGETLLRELKKKECKQAALKLREKRDLVG